ncbi:NAD-dependent epimerase/dehydratase family protein [Parapedobacter tibetensis]|uniref:NAD-dependent epimerase/dehydratase family protein n=1 Tax=Parapedobacter tibetensis TaxID=2972951 RepID=UPI00214D80BA|nr:NAD-dependent epimerase/dehydratase family protein [Parapedobacter tibetensis]
MSAKIAKILITGASGFIGYHLLKAAKSRGFETHAGIRKGSEISHLQGLVDDFVYLQYDSVENLVSTLSEQQYQYIIHTAALTRSNSKSTLFRVNVEYTKNLALAAQASKIPLRAFVFVSSLAAVGPLEYDAVKPINEHSPLHPVTAYGQSKCIAEQQLLAIKGLPLTIIRPTAVYGPRERDLLVLFNTIASGWDFYIGRIRQKLSFVYVEDLAGVIIDAAIQRESAQEPKTYTISDGNIYGRYEVADLVKTLLPRKAFRLHLPLGIVKAAANVLEWSYRQSVKPPVIYRERINELTAPNWECDIAAAKQDLAFAPQYDLKKGLAKTISWYKANKWMSQ